MSPIVFLPQAQWCPGQLFIAQH